MNSTKALLATAMLCGLAAIALKSQNQLKHIPSAHQNLKLKKSAEQIANNIAPTTPLPATPSATPPITLPSVCARETALPEQLATINQSLSALSQGTNPYLSQTYQLQIKQLAPQTPKDCNDLSAVAPYFNSPAKLKALLEFNERKTSTKSPAQDRHRVTLSASAQFATPNPWRSPPGCLYLDSQQTRLISGIPSRCNNAPLASASERPPRLPIGTLNQLTSNQQNASLTIAPEAQSQAQQVLDCMTGQASACQAAKIDPQRWQQFYEGAAARRLGLIQVDVATGRIEVLASAESPCFTQDHDGIGHDPRCPSLPHGSRNQAAFQSNHALSSAMPGSENKPLLTLGLLRSDLGPHLRTAGSAALKQNLRESKTPPILDRLYGREQQWQAQRLKQLPQAAADLGWNQGCPGPRCAQINLLPGLSTSLYTPAARILQHIPAKQKDWQLLPLSYQASWAKSCGAKPKPDWHSCTGGSAVDTLSELWGQGNALASPVGIANMFRKLAAAANGASQPPLLHLAESENSPTPTEKITIQAEEARYILNALDTHRQGGTAHSSCKGVLGAEQCNRLETLAGKTGTPRFHQATMTLQARQQTCDALKRISTPNQDQKAQLADCAMRPYKWFALAQRTAPGQAWGKIIVVLAERNYQLNGNVDSPDDNGSNVAAEAAFRFAFPANGNRPKKIAADFSKGDV